MDKVIELLLLMEKQSRLKSPQGAKRIDQS